MLKFVVHAYPEDAKAYENLASAYKQNGDNKKAVKTLKKGLKLQPELESSIKMMEELKK